MSKIGRNQSCPCGSGVKAKRCCGVRLPPSQEELDQAFVSELRRSSMPALRGVINDPVDLIELYGEVRRLPNLDLSCQLRLPAFLPPELERFEAAMHGSDTNELSEALPPAMALVDTPSLRAELARAVVALRDADRISERVAAGAFLDLDSESDCLVREALVAALALRCGASRTPSGLLLV
jgi:hypothetical protein